MSDWSPPSIPRAYLVGIGVTYVAVLGYAIVVVQRLLLGLLVGFVIGALYFGWRFLVAFEAIADALQRIATQREN